MAMERLDVATKRGVVLNGVIFSGGRTDTVVIAITGIHGNFYSRRMIRNSKPKGSIFLPLKRN